MAAAGQRLLGFGDVSFSETDQDANSALTELDKGLRSGRIGEQCETIVRFPRLFEKYPFPILINSACLKLAEVFRVGTNFLRMLVLKVMQQSDKHLDKILNIDEFVRRIFSVMYSNDPVARALTLRTLGSIAPLVSERQSLQHSIQNSLESHDAVELEAATYAAARFAAASQAFAAHMCSRVGAMVGGLATPVDVKLRLLGVLQQLRLDAQTAAAVRSACLSLLGSYPSQQIVIAALRVLTRLAAASVTDIPQQIETLNQYLREDPREGVKVQALDDLCHLAHERPHLWDTKNVQAVVQYALTTPYLNLKCGAISVLIMLASSVAVDKFDLLAEGEVLELCRESMFHHQVRLASAAIRLLTHLAIHALQEDIVLEGTDLVQEVSSAIETLLLLLCSQEGNANLNALRTSLQCIVLLCESDSDLCSQFVDILGSFLSHWSGQALAMVCECLCALGSRRCGVLARLESQIRVTLHQQHNPGTHDLDSKSLVLLCTLVLQAGVEQRGASPAPLDCPLNPWSAYRVARQAARYGHFALAAPMFAALSNKVSSEHLHFWLTSLAELSRAEECLEYPKSRDSALAHYSRAVSALKAATTPSQALQFQTEYVRLRGEAVRSQLQLAQACSLLRTAPPPAIAATLAQATRDDLQKCGRVVAQLRKCSREFRSLADMYGALYQTLFDADSGTLYNVQLLQQNALLIAQAVDRISQYNQGISGANEENVTWMEQSRTSLGEHRLVEAAHRVLLWLRDLRSDNQLTPQQVQMVERISQEIVFVPLCLPRFFFQSLQCTTIKLAVSPQQKGPNEPLPIAPQSQLALRVEGVVQRRHGDEHFGNADSKRWNAAMRQTPHRTIGQILVTVTSQCLGVLPQRSPHDAKACSDGLQLSHAVRPQHDYFQAQFLLALPGAGLHTIVVDTAILDEQLALWRTGPQSQLTVRVLEDAKGNCAPLRPPPGQYVPPPRPTT